MFNGKKILVGVTGGIAAYKTCELIRVFKKKHAQCRILMTQAAQKFITPLTFEILSEESVLCDLFPEQSKASPVHINMARWANLLLICPATANIIGKIANGIADDLLSTTVMAATAPVIFCPAMNTQMYKNPVVQKNIEKLRQLGYTFIEPGMGSLACGEEGVGRLADQNIILDGVTKAVSGTDELEGKRVLITAGRTEEAIDPVRFLTNYSSGKMGFALAEIAALRGADVTLISGPNRLTPFSGVKLTRIQTANQMAQLVLSDCDTFDIIIMAAAVADYQPCRSAQHKIKKDSTERTLQLEPTIDILHELGKRKGKKILVGFALETQNEIANARQKMRTKNLDLIILNNPLNPGAGFGGDTNAVTIIDRSNTKKELALDSKRNIAVKIIDDIVHLVHDN